ncbi:hypothetical protein ABBQ32_011673 [Trebouxia sp. C0010 RCD-2024]
MRCVGVSVPQQIVGRLRILQVPAVSCHLLGRRSPFTSVGEHGCNLRTLQTLSSKLWPHADLSRKYQTTKRSFISAVATSMTEAPVGEWKSPISSELIVSQSIRLGSPVAASDGSLIWSEGRPTEGGRQVLVRRTADGNVEDILSDPAFNARTRVHEYGGGEYVVGKDAVYFSNFKDQRLYQAKLSGKTCDIQPLTPEDSKLRFADAVIDQQRNRLIAVCEDHSQEGEAVNTISSVGELTGDTLEIRALRRTTDTELHPADVRQEDLDSGSMTVLAGGTDFVAAPKLSPNGAQLAWVAWDHPNMPWDDTVLYLADVASDGSLTNQRKVAGGEDESVTQPVWSPENKLMFVSDRTGWWNIYQEGNGQAEAVVTREAEFAGPAWMFGSRSYQVLPDARLLVLYSDPLRAGGSLAVVDPASGSLTDLRTPFTSFGSLSVAQVGGKLLVATTGGSSRKPSAVALLEVSCVDDLLKSKPDQWQMIRLSTKSQVSENYLSEPMTIEYPTDNGQTAFMNYYAPKNQDYQLPPGQTPPLLVKIHGGPTSQASTAFNLGYQYWTSRGFAIADVNYGGSTGYGRSYRNRLRRNWGIVDVADCSNAAKHLAKQGKADEKRLCIDGGSAGGYTTLACLAFRDVFSAGASHYGVADLELLAQETHKFESRYLDQLIGPYPAEKKVYEERSPIHALDKFTAPTAFFQGTEDQVVPPNQATEMYEALKKQGLKTALVMFEGEQHGFRQATNIRRALDGEFFFYGKALGFNAKMPDGLEPVQVEN